jgi:hypothetical protein
MLLFRFYCHVVRRDPRVSEDHNLSPSSVFKSRMACASEGFFLGLFLGPEDGGEIFRTTGLSPNYMALKSQMD